MKEKQDIHSLNVFPLKFEVDDGSTSLSTTSNIVNAVAGCILAIAAGIIIFGPDSVQVSWSGPTFTQFWLLYPGPIATAAGLVLYLGQHLKNNAREERENTLEQKISDVAGANLEKLPEGYTLSLNKLGSETYQLDLVPADDTLASTKEDSLSQEPQATPKKDEIS
ncbi:hypothetical protein J7J47_15405 [Halomonas sp. ISL-60]|uniref:hypothetical protein n=1 Tax=Halomonas sp. ISL-56 TaxID=2819149 RepID=UPI001BE5EFEA|nr:hypothetical protein [Halomonas sp. ISL-56]MBT2773613.1 hypothetical protein [Halomonas sp. ISL-60]MBT2802102.1 hypothetical protein [Halomonas sp. ISL-56]